MAGCNRRSLMYRATTGENGRRGYQAVCECGWEGPDRTHPHSATIGSTTRNVWYDVDKSRAAARLDGTRHLGKLTPRAKGGTARPRDAQRRKLYSTEDSAFAGTEWARIIGDGSIEATKAWLNTVTEARWFQSRWGAGFKVRVVSGSGSNATYRDSWDARIMLSARGRKPYVVLHELAHFIGGSDTLAAHGKEYAGLYLFLVEHALGDEAGKRLRAAFVEGKVKHRSSALIPGAKPEQVVTKAASPARRKHGDETLRALVSMGAFGPPGAKARRQALAMARTLESQSSIQASG